MSSMDETLGGTTDADGIFEATGEPRGRAPELGPGQRVGRYVVLERLGAGAMGVVWSAWDPELDRRVALKLLLSRGSDGDLDRLRLQREAQALAKLSHPNVVGVFDVGTHDDQLFIAMEHVAGKTLRAWVLEDTPSLDARWQALRSAGRGLAAAHAVGLVHRDFKPDNVMIDARGRVRVMDFGLARGLAEPTPIVSVPELPVMIDGATLPSGGTELTRAGALVGTPAYMAPEQFVGQAADSRSDQFSFCVTAWELLTGKRPFAGDSLAAIVFAANEGKIVAPPPGTLGNHHRQLLERGLRADPAQRWPDLEALLAALDQDPSHRRRRWAVAGVVGVLAATAIGATSYSSRSAARRCGDAELQLEGSWDSARREAVEASFTASGSPIAADTAAEVVTQLDAWAQRWTVVHEPACTGEGTLAIELRPAQARCLATQRVELDALVEVLSHADAETVRNALDAVAKLPDPERCDDPVVLAAAVSPPPEGVAAEVERIRGELARVRSLRRAGDEPAASAAIEGLIAAADATEYLPVRAEAWREHGELLENRQRNADALATMLEASELALAAGDEALAAQSTLLAAGLAGRDKDRRETGLTLLQLADGMITHAGTPSELRRQRTHIAAVIAYEEGRFADALAEFDAELAMLREIDPDSITVGDVLLGKSAALRGLGELDKAGEVTAEVEAHFRRILPANHPKIASAIDRRGALLYERGQYAEARDAFEQAVNLYAAGLGPTHPETLAASGNLAGMQMMLGDIAGAEARYREVLAGNRAVLDPDDKSVGTALCNLAMVVANRDPAAAIELYAEGVAIVERKVGPEHPELAWLALNYATALRMAGQVDTALEWGRRSVAIREQALGPDHPHLAMSLDALGETYMILDQYEDAAAVQARAVAIWEKALGPEHPNLVNGLTNLGSVELTLGRHEDAAAHLRRAEAIAAKQPTIRPGVLANLDASLAKIETREGDPAAAITRLEARLSSTPEDDPRSRAELHQALAEARWAAGQRGAARTDMEAALTEFIAADLSGSPAERCRQWLARHGG